MKDNLATQSQATNLPQVAEIVRKQGWMVVAAVLIGAVAGYGWTLTQTPLYRSNAVVTLNPIAGADSGSAGVSKGTVAAQLDVLRSSTTADQVAEEIGRPIEAEFAQNSSDTSNIRITGIADNADRAALIANTYVAVYTDIRRELDLQRNAESVEVIEQRLEEVNLDLLNATGSAIPDDAEVDPENPLPIPQEVSELRVLQRTYQQQLVALGDQARFMSVGRVNVLDPASPPSSPFTPVVGRNVAIAALVGALLGVVLIAVRRQFDDAISSADELSVATGLPLLGVIPRDFDWKASSETHLMAVEQPASMVSEAFRTLRTSLLFARLDDPIRVLQITSARPGEGKSTAVANLGITVARAGQKVLLIDLDLRKPRLHSFFGLTNDTGFTSVLVNPDTRKDAVATSDLFPTLSVLTSGPRPSNPSELLASERARGLVASLAEDFDMVIIDCPPVLGISDPLVVSSMVDASALIVRHSMTTRGEAREGVELLEKVQAPLVGAIANDIDSSRSSYRYGYGYSYTSASYDYYATGSAAPGNGATSTSGDGTTPAGDEPARSQAT